ncbi:MAG: hypothetical protein ACRCUY_13120 [Thermoguttaceae bacterium]
MSPILIGSLSSFVRSERGADPHCSEVLIGGNSTNGLGVYRAELEKELGRPVGKATIDGCWVWEFDRVLKKYPAETKNVKVVLLSFRWNDIITPIHTFGFQKGNTYHYLKDVTDITPKNMAFQWKLRQDEKMTNKTPSMLPMRFSLRDIVRYSQMNINGRDHESAWDNPRFRNSESYISQREKLKAHSEKVKDDIPDSLDIPVADDTVQALWDFIEYCQLRNIFVVLNVTPRWHGSPGIPEAKNPGDGLKRLHALIENIDCHPNCRVIYLKDFRSILPDAQDEEYLFDQYHMSRNGATVYTHWLADQMQRDPKVMAALNTERKPPEFFVKRWVKQVPYAKESYRYLAGFIQKTPSNNGGAPAKPVLVASPPNNTPK